MSLFLFLFLILLSAFLLIATFLYHKWSSLLLSGVSQAWVVRLLFFIACPLGSILLPFCWNIYADNIDFLTSIEFFLPPPFFFLQLFYLVFLLFLLAACSHFEVNLSKMDFLIFPLDLSSVLSVSLTLADISVLLSLKLEMVLPLSSPFFVLHTFHEESYQMFSA